jgi:hypothetical protein
LHKALPGIFLSIFSSLTCLPKKPVFSKWDLLQWKALASLSLFLKSEKIPALLCVGKGPEYRHLPLIFSPFSHPTSLKHRSQITEEPVLRPFSYTKSPSPKCQIQIMSGFFLKNVKEVPLSSR